MEEALVIQVPGEIRQMLNRTPEELRVTCGCTPR